MAVVEQEQPVAHVGGHHHHHPGIRLLQPAEHVVERELLARGGELRLPVLGELAAVLGAHVERQVLTGQRGLQRGLHVVLPGAPSAGRAHSGCRRSPREVQHLCIRAEFGDARTSITGHGLRRLADAVAERGRLGEESDFPARVARLRVFAWHEVVESLGEIGEPQ